MWTRSSFFSAQRNSRARPSLEPTCNNHLRAEEPWRARDEPSCSLLLPWLTCCFCTDLRPPAGPCSHPLRMSPRWSRCGSRRRNQHHAPMRYRRMRRALIPGQLEPAARRETRGLRQSHSRNPRQPLRRRGSHLPLRRSRTTQRTRARRSPRAPSTGTVRLAFRRPGHSAMQRRNAGRPRLSWHHPLHRVLPDLRPRVIGSVGAKSRRSASGSSMVCPSCESMSAAPWPFSSSPGA